MLTAELGSSGVRCLTCIDYRRSSTTRGELEIAKGVGVSGGQRADLESLLPLRARRVGPAESLVGPRQLVADLGVVAVDLHRCDILDGSVLPAPLFREQVAP